jgi:hypothetical protein
MEWGMLMIRCPATGRVISTGYAADPVRFRNLPEFYSVTYCPACRAEHHWFSRDAWIGAKCEPQEGATAE